MKFVTTRDQARARRALSRMRRNVNRRGVRQMSAREIAKEIRAVRKNRKLA